MHSQSRFVVCIVGLLLVSTQCCFAADRLSMPAITSKLTEVGYTRISLVSKDKSLWVFVAKRNQKSYEILVDPATAEVKGEHRANDDADPDFLSSDKQSGYIDKMLDGSSEVD